MTAEILQFTRTKDPRGFDGLGIKIDVEKWCESWGAMFIGAQFAMRFCNFDHVEAEKAVRRALDAGDGDLFDEMSADWQDDIERLETVIEIVRAARARLAISQDRITRAERVIWRFDAEEYAALKAQNHGAILFYRMGDFYGLFVGDAEIAASALGIVLTKREGREPVPMCRVPVERAEDYLNRLIGQGYRIAICELIGSNGVFRREVVRLIKGQDD